MQIREPSSKFGEALRQSGEKKHLEAGSRIRALTPARGTDPPPSPDGARSVQQLVWGREREEKQEQGLESERS